MTVNESQVFRHIDKLVHTDPSYWPTFQLRNVKVLPHGKAKSKHANCVSLFEASSSNPVCLVGEVEQVEKDNLDRVLEAYQDDHDGTEIILPDVTNFSHDEEDGVCKLLVEGKAGWFEIQPSKIYRAIYNGMTEAVGVWYYLEDQHTNKNAQLTKNPEVDALYESFLKKNRQYETVETVEAVLHDCRTFLLSQMKKQDTEMGVPEEGEDTRMKWLDTNICQHLFSQSPDESEDESDEDDDEDEDEDEDDESGDSSTEKEEDEDDEIDARPSKRPRMSKGSKSAGLRPTAMIPRAARYRSNRLRTTLPVDVEDENDDEAAEGEGKTKTMIHEMKKAGASTGFLEAFLSQLKGDEEK